MQGERGKTHTILLMAACSAIYSQNVNRCIPSSVIIFAGDDHYENALSSYPPPPPPCSLFLSLCTPLSISCYPPVVSLSIYIYIYLFFLPLSLSLFLPFKVATGMAAARESTNKLAGELGRLLAVVQTNRSELDSHVKSSQAFIRMAADQQVIN